MPKIHKPGLKFRPIVSSINGPLHKLGREIHNIITFANINNTSHINNSFEFKEKVKNIFIPDNYVLVSLDVTSLFTNIPIELVKLAINNNKEKFTIVPVEVIINAIDILMNNTFFSFNNKIFKQIFGLPMGSPIAPICADLAMSLLESECLSQLDFNPLFYYRYVDDIITCIPFDKINTVVTTFNNFNEKLKFTFETENPHNNSIPFLDILLIRKGNKLKFDWFQKPTNSFRTLNFNSYHPFSQKIAIIKNFTDRVVKLSDNEFIEKNMILIKKILCINSYPLKLVEKVINDRIVEINGNKDYNKPVFDHKRILLLPYSEELLKKLNVIFKPLDLKIVSTLSNKLGKYFPSSKDRIENSQCSGVVYKIPCSGCDKCYIGQTGRKVEVRLKEHKASEKNGHKDNVCALARHAYQNKHSFDIHNFKILDKVDNKNKREFSEMFFIKKFEDNIVNYKRDCDKLDKSFHSLIRM